MHTSLHAENQFLFKNLGLLCEDDRKKKTSIINANPFMSIIM